MPFSLIKFLSGFNLFNGQSLGKLLFYVIISGIVVVIGIGIYNKVFVDRSVLVSNGGTYVINEESPKQDLFSFGCSNLRVEMFWKKSRSRK